MGKGDKKSRRGKIFMGSYGVRRPRKPSGNPFVPKAAKKTTVFAEQIVKPAPQPKVEQPKAIVEKPQVIETITAPVIEAAPIVVKETPSVATPAVSETIKKPAEKKAVVKKAAAPKKEAKPAKEKKAPAAKKVAPAKKAAAPKKEAKPAAKKATASKAKKK